MCPLAQDILVRLFELFGRELGAESFRAVVVDVSTVFALALVGDVGHAESIFFFFLFILAGCAARRAATCGSVSWL